MFVAFPLVPLHFVSTVRGHRWDIGRLVVDGTVVGAIGDARAHGALHGCGLGPASRFWPKGQKRGASFYTKPGKKGYSDSVGILF